MTPAELVKKCDDHNEFVTFDDGFVYFWPKGYGGLDAVCLRIIADELDKRNAEWKQNIDDYFSSDSFDKH